MAGSAAADPPAVVATKAGPVQGVVTDGVEAFRGIPFAAPPVGALRWRAPQPAAPWAAVRDATAFGPACPQPYDVVQSEDCLTLNVFRPAEAAGPLPVMVWFYGGALWSGSASLYPGDSLARQGVVVVTLNYRLGRLGFFAHPALVAEAPGEPHFNYGFLDQLAALEWVRDNIAAFGGDPGRVTIFGESAGGGSVMAHLVSPLSRGLFHGAIMESPGGPTGRAEAIPVTPLPEAEKLARDYAASRGITGDDAAALAALRAVPADQLVAGEAPYLDAVVTGVPVPGLAGGILDGVFLRETPEGAFDAGRQARVPVIVGANSRDLGLGSADSKEAVFALFGPLADAARQAYDPDGTISLDELRIAAFADGSMVEPARHLADAVAGAQPVWLYRFSYVAENLRSRFSGAPHTLEIPYVFGDTDLNPAMLLGQKATPADDAMAKMVSAYWVAFARTGDPNVAGQPDWPMHAPALDRLFDVTNGGIVVGPDPLKPRLDLWARLRDDPP